MLAPTREDDQEVCFLCLGSYTGFASNAGDGFLSAWSDGESCINDITRCGETLENNGSHSYERPSPSTGC